MVNKVYASCIKITLINKNPFLIVVMIEFNAKATKGVSTKNVCHV